ncbi:MAG: DJ-1/PfpI family protein [Pseudomonadota bacterium]
MKKALFIIAPKDFRDEELFKPMEILENGGVQVTLASTSLEEATGMLGGTAKADILIDDINSADYDAIVFIGGYGSSCYWENEKAHTLAKEFYSMNKVLAAICIAPVTLANAGVLDNKNATVYPSDETKEALASKNANYTGKDVEVDGKFITASGPEAAEAFGCELLKKIKPSGCCCNCS